MIQIKIEIKINNKSSLTYRKMKRKRFVRDNLILCRKAFKHGNSHKDYKNPDGLKLIIKARKELNYSDTTYSGDIYYLLWNDFNEI